MQMKKKKTLTKERKEKKTRYGRKHINVHEKISVLFNQINNFDFFLDRNFASQEIIQKN